MQQLLPTRHVTEYYLSEAENFPHHSKESQQFQRLAVKELLAQYRVTQGRDPYAPKPGYHPVGSLQFPD